MHFKRFKSYTYAFLWPRWNETRNQQQKENWKYVEIKQHTLNQSIGQRRNHKGDQKKYLEVNENENTTYQNLWDAEK